MKKRKKVILIGLSIVLLILVLTFPSEMDYYNWLEDKYNIKRSIGNDFMYTYSKDGIEIFHRSSKERKFGIFKTIEQSFEYIKEGDLWGEGFIIRSLGISKTFFEMEEKDTLWKILTQEKYF